MKEKTPPYLKALLMLSLAIGILAPTGNPLQAATKDMKKPTVKITVQTKNPTNKDLTVSISVKDSSGISAAKWALGSQKGSYFTKRGNRIKLNKGNGSLVLSENGTYTFYAKDKAGNVTIKKLKLSNIDKTSPVLKITASTDQPTNQPVNIEITASDKDSGINTVTYLNGKKKLSDFKQGAKTLSLKSGKGNILVSNNGNITLLARDKAGNQKLKVVAISNIDRIQPSLEADYTVMNQAATVTVKASDQEFGIKGIKYLKGSVKDPASDKWKGNAKNLSGGNSFKALSSGKYSILAEDMAGNKTVEIVDITLELRAVWISYLDFQKYYSTIYANNRNKANFQRCIDTMLDHCVNNNMNAVIVQVRPFSDALYPSAYFPWSEDLSGVQGLNPGFDPLKLMVEAAHKRGLEFHAWINPYRVAASTSDLSKLSKNNPAVKWLNSAVESKQRNVLMHDGKIYYNPSKPEVRNLIVNGVKEIVKNYEVDGIHFDDYFYPTLGSKYKSNFDAPEYAEYKKKALKNNSTPKNIVKWRQANVNILLKSIHEEIQAIRPEVVFGISPQGNMSNLYSEQGHYTDVKLWMASDQYIDYICPQIYWSFDHRTAAYDKMVNQWINARTGNKVNLYIGIAAYKAGISQKEASALSDLGWADSSREVLKKEVLYGRDTGIIDGYMFFRYEFLITPKTSKEMENLIEILN